MTELADLLEERAPELARRVLDEIYADPFWEARFGKRGRRFTLEDNAYHLSYLVEALRAGTPDPLVRYARWLQSVLTSRGMCSQHIAENFDRMARVIGSEVQGAEPALGYLREGAAALRYPEGPARAVQDAAGAVAARATAPSAFGSSADPSTLLSYLADALALGRPELFADHLAFAADFLERQGAPPGELAGAVAAARGGLESLPEGVRDQALAAVDAALARLHEGRP